MTKIGLEIHGYIDTQEKLFCTCKAIHGAKLTKPNTLITIPAKTPIAAVVPISLQDINQYELNLNDYISSKEEEIKSQKYAEASQLKNRVGEWTHFYRNATDENNISIGNHELKVIRLKTNDKRNYK